MSKKTHLFSMYQILFAIVEANYRREIYRMHIQSIPYFVTIYNKYQVSKKMNCSYCKNPNSALYFCCSESNKACYYCTKETCSACGKKKTRPVSSIKIKDENHPPQSQLTCKYCKKNFQKNSCVQFECKHICCLKCLSKKIIDSIKSGSWERNWEIDQNLKTVECNCAQASSFDLSAWMEEYCFCCGEKFYRSHKVVLKFNLVIMQFCRNKLLYDEAYSALTVTDINRLSKECKSCSNLIDGYKKVIGLEDSYGFQCNDCWKPGAPKRRNGHMEEKAKCIICQFQEKTSSMIKRDDFYLCKICYDLSKSNQDKKYSIRNDKGHQDSQKPKLQQKKNENLPDNGLPLVRQCLICQFKIVNSASDEDICQKCIRDNGDSPLVQQLKSSQKKTYPKQTYKEMSSNNRYQKQQIYDIRPQKQVIQYRPKNRKYNQIQMPDFKKKLTLGQKAPTKCLNCYRNIEFETDSNLEIALCDLCISQNQRQLGTFKRSTSQSISSARIRDRGIKNHYKSAQQHRQWRKSISYQQFLRESQEIDIHQSLKKPIKFQYNVKTIPQRKYYNRVPERSVFFAKQSIIQEIPDMDYITIRAQSMSTAICAICRCTLEGINMFSYKTAQKEQITACLHCQLLSQAKNL